MRIYDNGFTELAGSAVENEVPVIGAGHSGAWFNAPTSGQGQFIDIEPQSRFMFLSWFTYTGVDTAQAHEHQWYTAQGNYHGGTAVLDLYETLGGSFDAPDTVETLKAGTMDINFSDCETAVLSYTLDAEGRSGDIGITRVVPGAGALCENLAGLN